MKKARRMSKRSLERSSPQKSRPSSGKDRRFHQGRNILKLRLFCGLIKEKKLLFSFFARDS